MPADRDKHLAWCKQRALGYLDHGDVMNAFTSMCSDLNKHPDFIKISNAMFPIGMLYVQNGDINQLRHWIEGFN